MADDERLARQGIGLEAGKQKRYLGNILHRRELGIDRARKHHLAHDFALGKTERIGRATCRESAERPSPGFQEK